MRITRFILVEMATIMSVPLFGSGKNSQAITRSTDKFEICLASSNDVVGSSEESFLSSKGVERTREANKRDVIPRESLKWRGEFIPLLHQTFLALLIVFKDGLHTPKLPPSCWFLRLRQSSFRHRPYLFQRKVWRGHMAVLQLLDSCHRLELHVYT
jgi:hypothetical protein